MKKEYITPVLELVKFYAKDIITASDPHEEDIFPELENN